ncbi:hypothetical protein DOY81_004878 [Sarcophaga bullata]|nr:hypothetical protein DOY81_004878 [Sarcophaga bullata]
MESSDMADESLDSVPQPVYEPLEEEDVNAFNSIKHTTEEDVHYASYVEEDKEDDGCTKAADDEVEQSSTSTVPGPQDVGVERKNSTQNIDNEDFSLEYEDEEGISEEYVHDESDVPTYAEHTPLDNKNDTLIVQGNDGMIKKIKICNTKEINHTQLGQSKTDGKSNKSLINSPTETNNILTQRSSTPLSREYLALQRSVNESKILTEFVTEAAYEKPRKLRTKDPATVTSTATDHSYSSVRKNNQLTPEKYGHDDSINSISPSHGKRQHKRYAPLKDGDTELDSSSQLRPRSRSKSMHNSELNLLRSHKKLKKWPSEERLHKRPNMRSENSEFAQKQMEFLQRVIHACETPRSRSRSRSRSCGRRTPNQMSETSTGRENVGDSQKNSVNKDRSVKRNKNETVFENDDHQSHLLQGSLAESSEPQDDDQSVNESNASVLGVSLSIDTLMTDNNDTVETHLKSIWQAPPKSGYDSFCWKCHEINVNLCCCKCIRSFHASCIKISKFDNIWLCPECTTVENMLNNPKRSRRNELSLDLLSQLLSFALKRMRYAKGHYNFVMPYEESATYMKYIVNPVTLSLLQKKIENKEFRCAEEFVNETKWMLHNAYVLSSRNNTKTVLTAKSIFKICRQEANEIETCAECYLNANTRTDWFVDVCSQPHLLLWAKLKGFPYWPAKAMGLGQNSLINVRFFGEHDRAFVPLKDCFLYSEQDPNTATGKRAARELADCIKEVEEHIGKIRTKVGGFKYAPFKTPYEPLEEIKQLSEMMPGVEDFMRKQQGMVIKPSLQFKIYKTADNNLSIVQKASTTPELQSTAHDSDEKRKKPLLDSNNDLKKSEENISSPPKYEVVSKVSSDDSNSSKLSTVILKRKSMNGESKKLADDEAVELPLPKMTKIEDNIVEEDSKRLNAKRKLESQSIEKPKQKHSKLELKVPIMTIKTSLAKEQASISSNGTNNKTHSETNSKHIDKPKDAAKMSPTIVVENLVRNKQGVTIKKLSKEVCNNTEETKLNNSKESVETQKEKVIKQKADDEKARENQKVNNILKGLIPFVEVKKEIISDNEEETEKMEQMEKTDDRLNKDTNSSENTNQNKTEKSPEPPPQENKVVSANATNTNSSSLPRSPQKEESPVLLTQVKEEVLSDEELTDAQNNSNIQKTKIVNDTIIEKQAMSSNNVRIVGDTTIQKLSNKSQSPYPITSCSSAGLNNNSTNSYSNTKRTALKGVPYGPLPASAFPKSLTSKSLQSSDINMQPRAKKSFPQHSPPIEKLRPSCNQNSLVQTSSPMTNQHHLDQKRAMAKNTMVTIPVDVAANRTSTSAGTIIIGSIPVPPLTAVSKTVPSSAGHNSTARNSPATVTVSGTSTSITTTTVLTQSKTTTTSAATSPTNVRNSPTPVISTSLIATVPSTNQINPITRSTPPPLAGLSNTNLVNAQQTNDTQSNTTTIGTASTQQSTDTHLLGGLVTPTLASAITDVICRGPPKLAVRPSGPLQSEGHPMFPSQAGPVCKRLVENVHKLTDFFISVVEDTMGEMAQGDDPSLQAKVTLLTMELERSKQAYEQEIAELKRTSDLMLCEMRKSMENEKTRLAIEIRKQCEMERLRSVEETKRKQWCANCFREANFYCCWNTSYCDYPCQQLHWSRHALTCAQTRPNVNEAASVSTSTTATQSERHHTNKSSSSISMNSSGNFNKPSTTISQKKEKSAAKNSSANHMMSSSSISASATTSRTNSDVLKLPTNTYLRPVSSNSLSNQTLRCNTTYSIPVQRFTNPLPITTPANTNIPQTYTLVQQGSSWVMSCPNSNGGSSTTTNSSTIAAPVASVPQVSGQQRSNSGSIMTNKSPKAQIRYHHHHL